jgi:hypothetical protein
VKLKKAHVAIFHVDFFVEEGFHIKDNSGESAP